MSKVYVTNYAHEYLAAKEYGELVAITSGFVNLSSLDRLRTDVVEKIADSHPEDWVLISGMASIAVVVCLVWYAKHKQIKMLVKQNKRGEPDYYKEVKITDEGMQDMFRVLTPQEET